MHIRLADETDAAACLRIYEPIVGETAISFEETAPTADEMANRIRMTLVRCPWLVCCDPEAHPDQCVVGYAYAGSHRTRTAYRWTVESAVYVGEDHKDKGVGSRLYLSLFDILRAQGFRTVVAGATLPNASSVALHERLGFKTIGVFHNVGFKFNRYHDTQWFELDLQTEHAPHDPVYLPKLMQRLEISELLRNEQ